MLRSSVFDAAFTMTVPMISHLTVALISVVGSTRTDPSIDAVEIPHEGPEEYVSVKWACFMLSQPLLAFPSTFEPVAIVEQHLAKSPEYVGLHL